MNKMRWKLMLAGVFLAGAFGGVALKVAQATPPKGVTNVLIAGPVELDDIDVLQQGRRRILAGLPGEGLRVEIDAVAYRP